MPIGERIILLGMYVIQLRSRAGRLCTPFALINNAGVAKDGAVVLGGSEAAIMKHLPSTRWRRRRGPRLRRPARKMKAPRGVYHFFLSAHRSRRDGFGDLRGVEGRGAGAGRGDAAGITGEELTLQGLVDLARAGRVGLLCGEKWESGLRSRVCGGRRFGSARRRRRGSVYTHGAAARRNCRRAPAVHELTTVTIFTPRRRPRS